MTTRGMGTVEFTEIGDIIADRLLNPDDQTVAAECRRRVAHYAIAFPYILI